MAGAAAPAEYAAPKALAFLSIACTFCAGLGEWKKVNDAFGALPKAASLGVIGCAVLWFLLNPDFREVNRALSYLFVFSLLLFVPFFASMNTWLIELYNFGSISRSFEKLLFQFVSALYAVGMVYLFGFKAIDYFFYAVVLANLTIVGLEIPRYGVAESLQSVIEGIRTYGEAEGFMRSLELHDLTFLFGQFLIFYLMFAPRKTEEERKKRRLHVLICLGLILLGFKRLIFQAIGLGVAFVWVTRRLKSYRGWFFFLGAVIVFCCFLYVYLIYSGWLVAFARAWGVNMMGRDEFWTYASDYYEFSFFWRGLGFEAVDTLVHQWAASGLINHPYPLHNDYLKVYMELGTFGLFFWAGIQYVYYPQYWLREHSGECALLYFSVLAYMSVTYLTDNTACYFWSSIGLRLLPMAYSYTRIVKEDQGTWRPPSAREIADMMRGLEMEEQPND